MLIAMDSALRIGFDSSRPSTIYWMLPFSIPHKAIIDSIASPPLTRYQVSMNFFSSNGATYSSWRGGGGVVGKFPGCHCEGQVEFGLMPTRKLLRRRVFTRSSPEHSESQSGSRIGSWIQKYLPSEDIREPLPADDKELDRLTVAETARTLIEVNSQAALMFSEDMGDVQQNVIWPDVPYLTDENGDIYFKASNDDRILRNFISDEADETLVHVIIGVDNVELLAEMEAAGSSVFNFGAEEAEYEDVGLDYDSEEDDLVIYDEEEDEDDDDAISEMSNDWSSAETMQSTHPVHFARKIAEVVSNANLDWMDQPSASIVIQGLLRPAFVEEHRLSKKLPFIGDTGINDRGKHIKGNVEGEMDTDQSLPSGTTFYKLEILNIQLVSACGNQCTVKIQDFHLARPDIIAHSAANILSRLKAGGEKTTQALKALCWRLRGIKVEEASIIGLDSAGFDLRVCSGTQIQTLRFAFVTRATSEFSAEKQTHDLLFPRF